MPKYFEVALWAAFFVLIAAALALASEAVYRVFGMRSMSGHEELRSCFKLLVAMFILTLARIVEPPHGH